MTQIEMATRVIITIIAVVLVVIGGTSAGYYEMGSIAVQVNTNIWNINSDSGVT